MDDDKREGLKRSMSEPAKKRAPVVVRVFKKPRIDDDSPERDYEVRKGEEMNKEWESKFERNKG